jgi:head-tail adaptor
MIDFHDIGTKDRRITLKKPSGTRDATFNQPTQGQYTDIATVWAARYFDKGNEKEIADKQHAIHNYTYIIGFDSSWSAVSPEWILTDSLLDYEIKEVTGDKRLGYLKLKTVVKNANVINVATAAPTNLDVSIASPTSLTLTWTQTSDTIDGYIIERSASGNFDDSVEIRVASGLGTYTDRGLGVGSYSYKIKSYLGGAETSFTDAVSATLSPFTFTVSTALTGTSESNQFTLPLVDADVNYVIDWGDGTIETHTDLSQLTHTYAQAGVYEIKMQELESGGVKGWKFDFGGDCLKFLNVSRVGCFVLSETDAFENCQFMTWTATDPPNFTTFVIDKLFRFAFNFNADVSNWDMSNITTARTLFRTCRIFNSDVSNWNTSNFVQIDEMFRECTSFDQSLADWNISNVRTAPNFLLGVTLSAANYDATLISWAAQNVQNNVNISFGNSKYTSGGEAEAARNTLINTYGWTITDGGATIDPSVTALLNQADTDGYTPASGATLDALDTYVKGLKSAGIWDKLDILYVFATNGDSDFATYNILDPTMFKSTKVNNPTFTTNEGFTGDGSSAYLDTGWNPANDGVNYSLGSASYGVYVRTNNTLAANEVDIGATESPTNTSFMRSLTGGSMRSSVNSNASTSSAVSTAMGFNMAYEDGVNQYDIKNGVEIGSQQPTFAATLTNRIFTILARGNLFSPDLFSPRQVSIAFAGADLSAEAGDFFTLTEAYMDALGKGVVS